MRNISTLILGMILMLVVSGCRFEMEFKDDKPAAPAPAQAGVPVPHDVAPTPPATYDLLPTASALKVPGRELCFIGGQGFYFGGHGLCNAWDQAPVPDRRLLELRFQPVRAQLCVAESVELGLVMMPCRDLQAGQPENSPQRTQRAQRSAEESK